MFSKIKKYDSSIIERINIVGNNVTNEDVIRSELIIDEGIGKVSLVGVGMRSHAGIASTAFNALADAGINIQMISTSEIKITIVISGDQLEEAVKTLHSAFNLGD